jgi:ketosteroid isomerase-like protein
MDIERAIEQYHSGLDMFALGDPEPIKAMYARGEDVLLANPFGGSSRGWDAVSKALDFASSKFREGSPVRFEEVSRFAGPDLVTLFGREHWETKVGGRDERSSFDLRVTTTFRLEGDEWQLVGRHADPLTTPHPDGPIRPTN